MFRARADDRGPGAHQFAQLMEYVWRQVAIILWEDQGGVAGAAGQREAAVFHLGAMQQHIGVHRIIVVTWRQFRLANAHFHGGAFPGEIGGVRHGPALLQQELAA